MSDHLQQDTIYNTKKSCHKSMEFKHVLFSIRALNSSVTTPFQLGSDIDSFVTHGKGEKVVESTKSERIYGFRNV